MVRVAGSYFGIAEAFKVVAEEFGWKHIVLVGDDDTTDWCWFAAKAFDELLGSNENYKFSWLRLAINPNNQQLDNLLEQIRARSRGWHIVTALCQWRQFGGSGGSADPQRKLKSTCVAV